MGPQQAFNHRFRSSTATVEPITASERGEIRAHTKHPVILRRRPNPHGSGGCTKSRMARTCPGKNSRSEEHTSELQSRGHLVCRLLLEKKKRPKVMSAEVAAKLTIGGARSALD